MRAAGVRAPAVPSNDPRSLDCPPPAPGSSLEGALSLSDRLHSAYRKHPVPGTQRCSVTVHSQLLLQVPIQTIEFLETRCSSCGSFLCQRHPLRPSAYGTAACSGNHPTSIKTVFALVIRLLTALGAPGLTVLRNLVCIQRTAQLRSFFLRSTLCPVGIPPKCSVY